MKDILDKTFNILKYILIIAFAALSPTLAADIDNQNILFINSYHPGYSWSDNIVKSFRNEINDKAPNYHIYIEYMDTKRFDYNEIKDSFYNIIKTKYKDIHFDIIIPSDDNATYFTAENYDSLFNGYPVLFCGVNNYQPDKLYANPELAKNITGILEYTDFVKTCRAAKIINPETDKFIFLVDNTPTGVGFRNNIEQQLANTIDIPYEILDGKEYTTREMIEKVTSYDKHTAIVTTIWFRDKANEYYANENIIKEISEKCKSPLYMTIYLEDTKGSIGGYVNDPFYTGKILSRMAFEILSQKSISELPIIAKGTSKYLFDLDILRKQEIPLSATPSGSDFIGGIDKEEPAQGVIQLESWEKVWLEENPVLKVGLFHYPPLMIIEENPEGICIDYIKLLAQKTGIKIEFDISNDNLNDCLKSLNSNNGPILIPGITLSPERDENILFTKPWLELQYALFVKSNEKLIFYSGLESLKGQKIAVEKDSLAYRLIKNEYPSIILKAVNSVEEGLRAVSSGLVYGWIGSQAVGVYQAKTLGLDNVEVGTSIFELGKKKLSIAINKDSGVLNGILQKAMVTITEDELLAFHKDYCGNLVEKKGITYLTVLKIAFTILPIFTLLVVYSLFRLKKVSNILSDSEKRLNTTFQSISEAVITADCNGNVTRMNLIAEKLTGWKAEEALGRKLIDVYYTINSETDQETPTQISTIIENGKIDISDDLALISKNKKRYQISESVAPVYGTDGKPKGIVLVFKDITAQYEIERRIRQAERERELILDNITVGICFMDRNMNIVRLNKKMANIYNRHHEELIGHKCYAARFNRENVCSKCAVHEALSTGKICKGDFPYTPQDYDFEMIGVPIIENGTTTGVLEMVFDVTEYRKLQKNLETTNEQLIEHSGNLENIVKDRTKELNEKNKQLNAALLELKRAQSQLILSERMTALAQLIAGIAHEINTPLGAMGSSGDNISFNMQHLVKNLPEISRLLNNPGSEIVTEMLDKALNNKRNENPLSTKEMRTIRKTLEEELNNEKISDYRNIARILVDMNLYGQWKKYTPLLYSENCSEQLSELSVIVDIYSSCNTIKLAIGKASRIVKALKNYIQSGDKETEIIVKEPINLKNSLLTVILLYQNKLKNAIELITEFGDVPEILGISDELNQVWSNLIQNALYAIEKNGKITIRLYPSDNGAVVDIEDNGCGMTDDVKERLFEPLFTTKPPGEGTGLGLDIARKIIEETHNGTIDIQSQTDKGTKVTVWLPVD